jgi:hypothetical protein
VFQRPPEDRSRVALRGRSFLSGAETAPSILVPVARRFRIAIPS